MEDRLGNEFDDVRLHTGGDAAKAASSINARAFTTGSDIVFAQSEYAPNSESGSRLLVHELAHTMQQRGGPSGAPPSNAKALERGADLASAGFPGAVAAGSTGAYIARQDALAPSLPRLELKGSEEYLNGVLLFVIAMPAEGTARLRITATPAAGDPHRISVDVVRDSSVTVLLQPVGLLQLAAQGDNVTISDTVAPARLDGERPINPSLPGGIATAPPPRPPSSPTPAPAATQPVPAPTTPAAPAPTTPAAPASSVKDKADRVRDLLGFSIFSHSKDILDIFRECSPGEFQDLQDELGGDMDEVLDTLTAFDAVMLGTLGPVVANADKLNENRAEYVVQAVRDYGVAEAQVFLMYMFSRMYTSDIKAVLQLLADQKNLGRTVGDSEMTTLQPYLKGRGADPAAYEDRDFHFFHDTGRAISETVGDFFGSSELAKSGRWNKQQSQIGQLPEEYQKWLSGVQGAEWEAAMTPGNIAYGMVDYVTLGIPLGLYSAAKGVVVGTKDIITGDPEKGIKELLPAVIVVLTHFGAKAIAAKGAAGAPKLPPGTGETGELKGPAGTGQFTLPEYSGPLDAGAARLGAIMELNPAFQEAGGLLVERLGPEGLQKAARLLSDNPAAARFVVKGGMPALEALVAADGDIAKAEAAMASPKPLLLPAASMATPLERLTTALLKAGISGEAVAALGDAVLARLTDPAVLQQIEKIAELQSEGKVAGLDDWVRFNAGKAAAELADGLAELREAQRLAVRNPGSVIRIGREANAPIRPGTEGTTKEPLPDFDISIETPSGAIEGMVEVTGVESKVSKIDQITNGVRHAADKVVSRAKAGKPLSGAAEVTIQVELDVGEQKLRSPGMTRTILPDGTVTIKGGNGAVVSTTNLLDDVANNLGKIKNNAELSRVTLVDSSGSEVAVYERSGGVWKRVK